MGLCTSNPLSGINFDADSCTPTYSNTDGVEIDLAAGTATLSGGTNTRLPANTYPHAYVKMRNPCGLKGSYELNSTTYCSKSDATAVIFILFIDPLTTIIPHSRPVFFLALFNLSL